MFVLTNSELGCKGLVQHSLEMGTQAPIWKQPYRTPVVRQQAMNEMVQDMQKHGVVKPSSSPRASPVVLVSKKEILHRLSIEFCDKERCLRLTKG